MIDLVGLLRSLANIAGSDRWVWTETDVVEDRSSLRLQSSLSWTGETSSAIDSFAASSILRSRWEVMMIQPKGETKELGEEGREGYQRDARRHAAGSKSRGKRSMDSVVSIPTSPSFTLSIQLSVEIVDLCQLQEICKHRAD